MRYDDGRYDSLAGQFTGEVFIRRIVGRGEDGDSGVYVQRIVVLSECGARD